MIEKLTVEGATGRHSSTELPILFCERRRETKCSIPDDYIDKRRFPLFFARDVLQALVAKLKAENAVAPE